VDALSKLNAIVNALAKIPRIGWIQRGVERAETVLEHSALVAMFSAAIAEMVGASVDRAMAMAIVHDVAEADLGNAGAKLRERVDWRSVELETIRNLGIEFLERLYSEYAEGSSKEARVVALADKLATLTKACEYYRMGFSTGDLIDAYKRKIRELAWPEVREALEKFVAEICRA